ncbi:fibronectin type III domain-containing protein [Sphingobacterium luzhongxinii]|uniref:fibronectin type III domain-containing protein n=1 Tax=Sphingobacterium luzhongxinii TaxID=2654181 RepID=UPI0013D95120|nr:fibronectin type III domain-containing protein [Sphingobacterium sp. xlx-73]
MNRLLYFILTLIFSSYGAYVFAQERSSAVAMIGRVDKAQPGILLRWAPTSSEQWLRAIRYGFRLERYTVLEDGRPMATPHVKLLGASILPRPVGEWESLADQDDHAAVIAEAIYGEDFEIQADGGALAEITAKSSALDQRFSLSLYAADHSFSAAKLAGWAWEDRDISTRDKYLYRVILLNKPEQSSDTASVYMGYQDWSAPPKPVGLAGVYGDHTATLSWNYRLLSSVYHSYVIEKSTDGRSFAALEGPGITDIAATEEGPQELVYYIDSLDNNQQTYYYRIKGITAFGDTGPYSDTIQGMGEPPFTYVPRIRRVAIDAQQQASLVWDSPSVNPHAIDHFRILQAIQDGTPYQEIGRASSADTTFVIPQTGLGNYYKVAVHARNGTVKTSQSYFYQAIDSVPPAAPIGLQGVADTSGRIHLQWTANTEPDLLGYRIYRSQHKGEVPMLLQDSVYTLSAFTDSVSLHALNSHMYYAVAALDQRYNSSSLSEVVEIKKPDRIPPVSPLILGYDVRDGVVHLSYKASNSSDVSRHKLLRKVVGASQWDTILDYDNKKLPQDTLIDATAAAMTGYLYTIIALDDSHNQSDIIREVAIDVGAVTTKIATGFRSYVDREARTIELEWRKRSDVQTYHLYRGLNDNPPSLWKELPGDTHHIVDDTAVENSRYRYGLRIIKKDGSQGKLEWLDVKY